MFYNNLRHREKKITTLETFFLVGPHADLSTGCEQSKYYEPVWAQKAENHYSSSPFPRPVLTRYVSFMKLPVCQPCAAPVSPPPLPAELSWSQMKLRKWNQPFGVEELERR